MHTLAGAKLLKLIAVKLADRNAGKISKGKPCIGTTANTKRKFFRVSRNKSINLNPARFTVAPTYLDPNHTLNANSGRDTAEG